MKMKEYSDYVGKYFKTIEPEIKKYSFESQSKNVYVKVEHVKITGENCIEVEYSGFAVTYQYQNDKQVAENMTMETYNSCEIFVNKEVDDEVWNYIEIPENEYKEVLKESCVIFQNMVLEKNCGA